MAALKLSIKRVYSSRLANVPVLRFDINKPDRKTYKSFVNELEQHIGKMQAAYTLRADQQLAGELRMLRRLLQDGFVAQSAYDKAKARMLQN